MRIFFTTKDFQVDGLSYAGIPFLLYEDMRLAEPANAFLVYVAIHRGGSASPNTWKTYGWHLYDYFSFLEANSLEWNEGLGFGAPTIVGTYRNWSARRNSAQTVNHRLGTVIRFYKFAHSRKWISVLPWDWEDRVVHGRSGTFLAHVASGAKMVETPDVVGRDAPNCIEVLTRDQIRKLILYLQPNKTHYLMVKLALATGLRREELLSFPVSYVINPDANSSGQYAIKVNLSPSDMNLKNRRPRSIFMPSSLMRELWKYCVFERSQREARRLKVDGQSSRSLFVNQRGYSYSSTMLNKVLSRASEKLGFYIHPHILRHSYATHELHAMKELKGRTDLALFWVKNRLGHSSIKTTEVYLHLLAELEHEYLASYHYDLEKLIAEE